MIQLDALALALSRVRVSISPRDAFTIYGLADLVALCLAPAGVCNKKHVRRLAEILANRYGWDAGGTREWLDSAILYLGEPILI